MPRRRASPKVEGKSGRSKLAQAASAAGSYDGESDFPIDDLPPDDLPVRDIAEDQDEQHPAHRMAIRAADLAGPDLADPVHDPSANSPEPVNLRSGGGHPTLSAAQLHEPMTRAGSSIVHTLRAAQAGLMWRDLSRQAGPLGCDLHQVMHSSGCLRATGNCHAERRGVMALAGQPTSTGYHQRRRSPVMATCAARSEPGAPL